MRLPKPENWTLGTSKRVIARIEKLFEQYEKCTCTNEHGVEQSEQAKALDLEMLHLWDELPPQHRPAHMKHGPY